MTALEMPEFNDQLEDYLPEREQVLWHGGPTRKLLALHLFHWRKVAVYFAVLMLWRLVTAETGWLDTLGGLINLAIVGAVALGLLHLLAHLIAISTTYTITSQRVVFRFGVALPMTVNLPFNAIEQAGVRRTRDGSGDLCLKMKRGQRVSYTIMWPLVRPWHFLRPQPALRGLPNVDVVAQQFLRGIEQTAGNRAASNSADEVPDLAIAATQQ
ncbi:MAG: photosynthetic complex putative assembly protein PuhB [Pseudomonadota bacterium]